MEKKYPQLNLKVIKKFTTKSHFSLKTIQLAGIKSSPVETAKFPSVSGTVGWVLGRFWCPQGQQTPNCISCRAPFPDHHMGFLPMDWAHLDFGARLPGTIDQNNIIRVAPELLLI